MNTLRALFRDQTWIAHLVGLVSITATQVTSGNAVVSGIIAALTAVFHVCQTFGNGTAVPATYVAQAPVEQPTVPAGLYNAAGDTPLQR